MPLLDGSGGGGGKAKTPSLSMTDTGGMESSSLPGLGGLGGGASASSAAGGAGGGDNGDAALDAKNVLPAGVGTNVGAQASLSMGASAKESIKTRMAKLRQSIMADFASTTTMGQNAGYLPPVGSR